jgi:hypothetical protein
MIVTVMTVAVTAHRSAMGTGASAALPAASRATVVAGTEAAGERAARERSERRNSICTEDSTRRAERYANDVR